MDTIIKTIGIVFVVITIVYLLKPNVMKWLMECFKQGRRLYFAALIRLALAIIFFSAYRDCGRPWIIFVFGILFMTGALLIFIIPLEKLKAYISWWQKQSLILLRVLAVIGLAFGAIIIYAA